MTPPKKLTSQSIVALKQGAQKIVAITAYDYTFAKLVDELVDIVLVGDSLGMVIQGDCNTLSVTLEDVIYHCRAVSRAISHAHLVADMPFMTYQTGAGDAIRNAGRLLASGKAEAVKLEGGVAVCKIVEQMVQFGIPVMGHVGLTPQSVHAFGGYKIQGRDERARNSILQDAIALEEAGVYAMVLEGMPTELAKAITERISVPTIGIGAGVFCDGQVLVSQDLLGMSPDFQPRFVKKYANFAETVKSAVGQFAEEVRSGMFPDEQHSF
ncbi:MAG: 3-methyl-2-oxobutanoate hydroxymethyltransferase [Deltaproteobacteria bacterium]|nr:3-methyl-2-oxobutanoate hydroxymethyltransferase [Deltaproteobacteria bacterium]